MEGNYYLLLGIGPDANPSQIRRAFRQRAHECHPDHDPAGAEHFREVKHAYDVLHDPVEKSRYDQKFGFRHDRRRHVAAPDPVDLLQSYGSYSPSLEEVTDLFARNFVPSAQQPKAVHVRDLNVEVVISPEEAMSGGHLVLGVPMFKPCPTCQGSGIAGFYACDNCAGRGNDQTTAQVDVIIPKGTADGTVIPISLRQLGIRNMNLMLHVRVA